MQRYLSADELPAIYVALGDITISKAEYERLL